MSVEVGSRLGTHEILSELGKGGMGEVWRARDSKLGREVAIKTLPAAFAGDAERLTRFEREARMLASLNHPNIAAIYGLEESSGTRFLILELVEGETLAEIIRRGPMSQEDAIKLALPIATAIEAAHEKGVVHRDLKPANIKVTPDGKVKVLDFGLAKALQSEEQNVQNSPTLSMAATAQGIILGTAAYMSPEQARGINVDGRTDVWAFGCVLYEMLAGRPAFRGEMVSDILASVLARDPDFTQLKNQLHPRLQEILVRCLEKDPKRRWQAIGDVRNELERLLASGLTVPAETAAVGSRTSLRTLLPVAVVVALVAAGVTWFLKPAPPAPLRPITRFEYVVPNDFPFRQTGRPILAVSPNGRHFVYNTSRGLALRSMDSLDARIIPGTEAALTNPFFSPDGEWVAYYSTEGLIKKTSIAGGAPVTICPSSNPFGASWGKNGIILFGQPDKGIMQVSSDGGTPELVVPTKSGEFAFGPSMLPDGKTVLYSLTRSQGATRWDQAEIIAQEVKSTQGKVVLRGGSDARYLPTGHLIYAVGNVLFAVAFDVNELKVKGGPVPLVQSLQRAAILAANTGAANYGLTDSGALVYVNAVETVQAQDTTLGIVDRNGVVKRLSVPSAVYQSPRFSPDRRRVAVETIADNGESSIWIYDLAGTSAIRRLTQTQDGSNTRPLWSRDGKRIYYGSSREKKAGIWSQLADGSGLPERLTTAPDGRDQFPESFSFDGKVLSFAETATPSGARTWSLWTVEMDLPNKQPKLFYDQPQSNQFGSHFSPDGKWIAYADNNADRPNELFGIYVQPYPPTGAKYEISKKGGAWPVWNPLGGELFYRLNGSEAAGSKIRAVAINTNPVPSFTGEKELSITGFVPTVNFKEYDIAANGKEFVMVFPVNQGTATAPPPRPKIQVILNWTEELKARVPTN